MKYLIFAIIPWLFVSCFPSEPPCCLEWTEEEYTIENTDEESVEVEQYEHGEHFSIKVVDVFDGSDAFSDIFFFDDTGNVFYTKKGSTGDSEKVLVKMDQQNELLWKHSIINDQSGEIYISSYAYEPANGTVFIAGTVYEEPVKYFIAKIAENESDSWLRSWGTEDKENRFGTITSIALDSEGNAFVTGHTSGTFENNDAGNPSSETASDGFLTKFDISGNLLWTKQSGKSFSDFYSEVAIDENDNIYLTGSENIIDPVSMNAGTNMFISKLTSGGKQIWKKISRHENEIISGGHLAFIENDIVFFGSRCVFTTLSGEAFCFPQPFLRRYDPDGKIIWEKRWRGKSSKISSTESIDVTVIKKKIYTLHYTNDQPGTNPDVMISEFTDAGDYVLSQIFYYDCQDYPYEIYSVNNQLMVTGKSSAWIRDGLNADCGCDNFIPFALILEPLDQ